MAGSSWQSHGIVGFVATQPLGARARRRKRARSNEPDDLLREIFGDDEFESQTNSDDSDGAVGLTQPREDSFDAARHGFVFEFARQAGALLPISASRFTHDCSAASASTRRQNADSAPRVLVAPAAVALVARQAIGAKAAPTSESPAQTSRIRSGLRYGWLAACLLAAAWFGLARFGGEQQEPHGTCGLASAGRPETFEPRIRYITKNE
jgi:hypothetical protein